MKFAVQQAASKQMPLDLGIEVQKDINGIEMGVLDNGIPYLTQRGLAGITGVARSLIQTISKEWEAHYHDDVIGKDRISYFKQYLFEKGFHEPSLHIETLQNGTVHYAYPDIVCMAFLEYYAFESKSDSAIALENYRKFAAFGLRRFIYEALDYTPGDKWKYHHDRVSLLKDSAPPGHFIIFQEITGLVVDLINADLTVNHKTIADISVGIAWGKYWTSNNLEAQFGKRIQWDHNYPDYYPQSASNPQPANAYPDAALPMFRQWFKQDYLLTKFPKYILSKANMLPGGKEEALKIGGMYQNKALPPNK
ncbi:MULTISPECIES: hypothetical protein [Ralstonia]|jgi:hypothetical protein|uniref:BstA-like C-terminal domain-containing protein n=1 Tax=Ralstonia pickettii OR214 TaxID=1264675 RepID=R0CL95_RALPI|nr:MULTISPECIES: hypothetical protein [Ralstonia]ENZ77491.1 hypothetical protein OR214_02492 [Ralstonia pickettii OR214]MBL4778937.1 hypothetical protein [Ralstonia sp.]MCM3579578.1 hypothetical protein [Ralstonia pickettii]MDR9386266.1 hypothetical protein [Ralstonia sp. 11b]OYU21911.1 MAG: hypothetical protein CFE42_16625 [Ralstonia sp. PBBBR1]